MLRYCWGLLPVLVMGLSMRADAQTLASSARQMTPGSLKLSAYYQGTRGQDLKFKQNSSASCSGGGSFNPGFVCGSEGETEAEGDGEAAIMQLTYQPWDGLQYYALFGAGNYRLETSSVSVRNVLAGDRPGFIYGIGSKAVLLPDTVVSPAIALDGRVAWQRYYFNELRPYVNAADANIDQRLDIFQYQLALEASHQFQFSDPKWTFEPYGGLKMVRSQTSLKDLKSGSRVGGVQHEFTPFLGFVVPVYEHEAVLAEASFVNGIQYSLGLQVKFK